MCIKKIIFVVMFSICLIRGQEVFAKSIVLPSAGQSAARLRETKIRLEVEEKTAEAKKRATEVEAKKKALQEKKAIAKAAAMKAAAEKKEAAIQKAAALKKRAAAQQYAVAQKKAEAAILAVEAANVTV